MTAGTSRHLRKIAALAPLLAVGLLSPALADSSGDGDWKWRAALEIEAETTNNAFNLDRTSKSRLRRRELVNVTNGRLRDMESVNDYILVPEIEIGARRRNELGEFSIRGFLAYETYTQNSVKSHFDLGLSVRQTLPGHSSVEVAARFKPDQFKKNYLLGTVGTGSISSSERIYRPGEFDETRFSVDYERRLAKWKSGDGDSNRLLGRVGILYKDRSFDNFGNRDLETWGLELAATVELGPRLSVGLEYGYAMVDANGGAEIVLLDESTVGLDLTGDLDQNDNNVRTSTAVDRSRDVHSLALDVKFDVTRKLRLSVGYEYEIRDYDSNKPLDLAYRDREDDAQTASVRLRWAFADSWSLALHAENQSVDSNRDASILDDEDASKHRNTVGLKLRRKF